MDLDSGYETNVGPAGATRYSLRVRDTASEGAYTETAPARSRRRRSSSRSSRHSDVPVVVLPSRSTLRHVEEHVTQQVTVTQVNPAVTKSPFTPYTSSFINANISYVPFDESAPKTDYLYAKSPSYRKPERVETHENMIPNMSRRSIRSSPGSARSSYATPSIARMLQRDFEQSQSPEAISSRPRRNSSSRSTSRSNVRLEPAKSATGSYGVPYGADVSSDEDAERPTTTSRTPESFSTRFYNFIVKCFSWIWWMTGGSLVLAIDSWLLSRSFWQIFTKGVVTDRHGRVYQSSSRPKEKVNSSTQTPLKAGSPNSQSQTSWSAVIYYGDMWSISDDRYSRYVKRQPVGIFASLRNGLYQITHALLTFSQRTLLFVGNLLLTILLSPYYAACIIIGIFRGIATWMKAKASQTYFTDLRAPTYTQKSLIQSFCEFMKTIMFLPFSSLKYIARRMKELIHESEVLEVEEMYTPATDSEFQYEDTEQLEKIKHGSVFTRFWETILRLDMLIINGFFLVIESLFILPGYLIYENVSYALTRKTERPVLERRPAKQITRTTRRSQRKYTSLSDDEEQEAVLIKKDKPESILSELLAILFDVLLSPFYLLMTAFLMIVRPVLMIPTIMSSWKSEQFIDQTQDEPGVIPEDERAAHAPVFSALWSVLCNILLLPFHALSGLLHFAWYLFLYVLESVGLHKTDKQPIAMRTRGKTRAVPTEDRTPFVDKSASITREIFEVLTAIVLSPFCLLQGCFLAVFGPFFAIPQCVLSWTSVRETPEVDSRFSGLMTLFTTCVTVLLFPLFVIRHILFMLRDGVSNILKAAGILSAEVDMVSELRKGEEDKEIEKPHSKVGLFLSYIFSIPFYLMLSIYWLAAWFLQKVSKSDAFFLSRLNQVRYAFFTSHHTEHEVVGKRLGRHCEKDLIEETQTDTLNGGDDTEEFHEKLWLFISKLVLFPFTLMFNVAMLLSFPFYFIFDVLRKLLMSSLEVKSSTKPARRYSTRQAAVVESNDETDVLIIEEVTQGSDRGLTHYLKECAFTILHVLLSPFYLFIGMLALVLGPFFLIGDMLTQWKSSVDSQNIENVQHTNFIDMFRHVLWFGLVSLTLPFQKLYDLVIPVQSKERQKQTNEIRKSMFDHECKGVIRTPFHYLFLGPVYLANAAYCTNVWILQNFLLLDMWLLSKVGSVVSRSSSTLEQHEEGHRDEFSSETGHTTMYTAKKTVHLVQSAGKREVQEVPQNSFFRSVFTPFYHIIMFPIYLAQCIKFCVIWLLRVIGLFDVWLLSKLQLIGTSVTSIGRMVWYLPVILFSKITGADSSILTRSSQNSECIETRSKKIKAFDAHTESKAVNRSLFDVTRKKILQFHSWVFSHSIGWFLLLPLWLPFLLLSFLFNLVRTWLSFLFRPVLSVVSIVQRSVNSAVPSDPSKNIRQELKETVSIRAWIYRYVISVWEYVSLIDAWMLSRRHACCVWLPLLLIPLVLLTGGYQVYENREQIIENLPVTPSLPKLPTFSLKETDKPVPPMEVQDLNDKLRIMILEMYNSQSSQLTSEQEAAIRKFIGEEVKVLHSQITSETKQANLQLSDQLTKQGVFITQLKEKMDSLNNKAEDLDKEIFAAKSTLYNEDEQQQSTMAAMEQSLAGLRSQIQDINMAYSALLAETKNCCRNGSFYEHLIQHQVAEALVQLNDKDNDDKEQAAVYNHLLSQYVSREDLEKKMASLLADLMHNIDSKVADVEEKAVNAEKHAAAAVAAGTVIKAGSESSRNTSAGISLTEQRVKDIVSEVLAVFAADKTGLVDYALESAGGSIISTRCSETYNAHSAQFSLFGFPLWYASNSPRSVIQPDVHPGQCWAFKGSHGYLVIQLSGWVKPSAFSIEHIPKNLSPSGKISSAPKHFEIYGLKSEKQAEGKLIGSYTYDENGPPLQYFYVDDPTADAFPIVELRITSNHGNKDYTCLYRFRVHGTLVGDYTV